MSFKQKLASFFVALLVTLSFSILNLACEGASCGDACDTNDDCGGDSSDLYCDTDGLCNGSEC